MTTFEYIQWKQNKQNHKSKIFRHVNQETPAAPIENNKQDVTKEDVFPNNKDETLKQELAQRTEDGKKVKGESEIAPKNFTDEE